MNNINMVGFCGNLVRDAELSYTGSGFPICKMSIAINRSRKVGDDWKDEVSYFDLVGMGKRYEKLTNYLTSGTKIVVDGYAKQERWEKDGVKRSKVVFIIDNIEFVGSKSETSKPDQTVNNAKQVFGGGSFNDDIPFSCDY